MQTRIIPILDVFQDIQELSMIPKWYERSQGSVAWDQQNVSEIPKRDGNAG